MTTLPLDPFFDLGTGVGQRAATFRFDLVDGVTGQILGQITPLRGASLSHSTQQTIKRRLSIKLGVVDTAEIDVVNNRVDVYMTANGTDYPLGRYLFTNQTKQFFSAGRLSDAVLVDEMFRVDQPIEVGINGNGYLVNVVVARALEGLGVTLAPMPANTFYSAESWSVGTNRGRVLESLAVSGDYFSPWFGNDQKLHFIRSFDPATQIPQFDYDAGNQVYLDGVIENDELLTAPNRILAVSNAATDQSVSVVGTADIPSTAPNSVQKRGFVVTKVFNLQLSSQEQATAVAAGIAQRLTIFETVSLSTPPDPRHDSYDVIRWQGEHWLELGWNMDLLEGGAMTHQLRKAYS
jgi:hypothetical protein